MSAKDKDVEIEDDLARGMSSCVCCIGHSLTIHSPEDPARAQGEDLLAIEEELRT
jgi:hypothetical protein